MLPGPGVAGSHGAEARFAGVLEPFQGGRLHTDADGRVRACDERFTTMVGLDLSDVVGASPPYPWWPPERIAWWWAQLGPGCASAVRRGKFEGDFMDSAGGRFQVLGAVSTLSGGQGDAGLMWVVYSAAELRSALRSMAGPTPAAGGPGEADLDIALRCLYDSGIVGVLRGEEDRVLDANEAFLAMIGYSRQDLMQGSINWANLTPEEWLELDARAGETMLRTGASPVIEKQYFHRDGSRVWVRIVGVTVQWHPLRWVSFVQDITAERATEMSLRQQAGEAAAREEEAFETLPTRAAARAHTRSSAQLAATFERAPVGMALISPDRRVLRANAALGAMTGRSVTELAGLPLTVLMEEPSPEPDLFAALAANQLDHYRCEVRVRRADGARRWASLSVARVGDGEDDYAIFHIEDISDRKNYEERLQHLADYDSLTGLLNRRRFHEEVDHALALARRYHVSGAVAMLDLDNFKYINDTLGHQTGDALLCAISAGLSSRLRETDVLARLGGDEFAVLLYATDAELAETVVRGMLAAVREQEVTLGGQRARTTASAGIVRLDQSTASTVDEVLANTDLTMYAAKESGGDGLLIYDASGPVAAVSRAKFVWIDRVRQALEEDRFTLLAQPILDLAHDEVRGAELLLRMRHGGDLVEPEHFLDIAEQHGLSSALDTYVVRHAIALIARLDSGPDFRWEVNISGPSLSDPALVGIIETQLKRHHVPPASLVFEITESEAIKNMTHAQTFASRVTDLGCGFALDDFGAGYGGFYYLKYLPLDYLKIDGEFIRELVADPTNQVIVQAMVALARPLGKQTIAEYVLDQDTLDLLRELNVDHAQGYHVGMPVAPDLLIPLHGRSPADPAPDNQTSRA